MPFVRAPSPGVLFISRSSFYLQFCFHICVFCSRTGKLTETSKEQWQRLTGITCSFRWDPNLYMVQFLAPLLTPSKLCNHRLPGVYSKFRDMIFFFFLTDRESAGLVASGGREQVTASQHGWTFCRQEWQNAEGKWAGMQHTRPLSLEAFIPPLKRSNSGLEIAPYIDANAAKLSTLTKKTCKLVVKSATSEVTATNLEILWIAIDICLFISFLFFLNRRFRERFPIVRFVSCRWAMKEST